MKRIFAALLASIIAPLALATTLAPVQLLNPAGSASGQAVVSNGATSAPTWQSIVDSVIAGSGVTVSGATGNVTISISAGGVSPTQLATQAANTVLGNATAATASPTAITVTGCNGAAQALQWTNGSGFGCNSSIATSGANANITSLSGITTPLSVSQGGIGVGTLAAHGVALGEGTSAVTTAAPGATTGVPLVSNGTTSDPSFSTASVAGGGTGRATLTTHGVLVGEGTAAIAQLAVGTTGQVLVGSTGADPAFGSSVGALTFTGAITPSSTAGIVGTTTNDSANAGSVGEFPTPSDLSSVPLTSGTAANGSSISLTAGDWDVSGSCLFTSAASTTSTIWTCGISTTSATRPASFSQENVLQLSTAQTNVGSQMSTPVVRISVASTTTVYLVGMCSFGTSTETLSGKMRARRIR